MLSMLGAAMLALAAAAAAGGPLLASKCCALGEQLNDWLRECVPLRAPGGPSVHATARVMFPPWISNETEVFDPTTGELLTGDAFAFLSNASAEAVFRFGQRPCAHGDTQFVYFKRTERYRLFANGSLQLRVFRTNGSYETPQEDKLLLPPEEWCSDSVDTGPSGAPAFVFLVCPCGRVTCVQRCCYPGALYVTEHLPQVVSSRCEDFANVSERTPTFYKGICHVAGPAPSFANEDVDAADATAGQTCENVTREVTYAMLFTQQPKCQDRYMGVILNSQSPREKRPRRVWLQHDGSALMEGFGRGAAFPRHRHCVERALLDAGDGHVEVESAFFCHVVTDAEPHTARNIYYSLLFLLGGAFLLLTLLAHALLPALRRTTHAKALCCHCAALLAASVALAAGHLRRRMREPYCTATAFIIQFSFLATFFWLNVMCFDLSWASLRMQRSVPGHQSRRRFLLYSLYGWGFPALITAVALFMQFAPEEVVDPRNPMRPNIGVNSCWFLTKRTTLAFYFGPIAVVMAANLVMFGLTVVRLRALMRGTSFRRSGDGNARAPDSSGSGAAGHPTKPDKGVYRHQVAVYAKLFLLMGVTWVTELVSWLVDDESNFFFYLTDAINLLRGVAIFALFCWKPLRERFGLCGGKSWNPSATREDTPESSLMMSRADGKAPPPRHDAAEDAL